MGALSSLHLSFLFQSCKCTNSDLVATYENNLVAKITTWHKSKERSPRFLTSKKIYKKLNFMYFLVLVQLKDMSKLPKHTSPLQVGYVCALTSSPEWCLREADRNLQRCQTQYTSTTTDPLLLCSSVVDPEISWLDSMNSSIK